MFYTRAGFWGQANGFILICPCFIGRLECSAARLSGFCNAWRNGRYWNSSRKQEKLMPDSTNLSGKLFDRYLARLSGAEFKVYVALLREQDKFAGKKARLTRKELALRTGLTSRYISI